MVATLQSFLNTLDKDRTIVFTNGCFDLLHQGHLYLLQEAKKLGDVLIVGINDDASVRRLKGDTRPVETLDVRIQHLQDSGIPDFVVPFSEDAPLRLIETIRPHILVKGGDYKKEHVVGNQIADQTVIIPLLEGYSTTKIIKDRFESRE